MSDASERPLTYTSTRGSAPELGFGDVLLAGLAVDGGLYCPTTVPELPTVTAEMSYQEAAAAIMAPYVAGTFDVGTVRTMADDAYRSFRSPSVCPVHELASGRHLLDLTQGPTLAFKDVALQMVGRMLDAQLERRGERVTVIGATSGDTGSAAIEALANNRNVDVVILHPLDRVSEVQRRQMTTVVASNISNVAIEGTFDDCQDLVKAAFADEVLRQEMNLAAVNSINWARVMAQIVYYVTSARAVRPDGGPVSFAVPTGNFGNILAGWYAKRMGLSVDRLIIASNRNDVLTRFFETGRLIIESVEPSLSPSMDIQISSNFERLLWEASGRDGDAIVDLLAALRSEGRVDVPEAWCDAIRAEFDGYRLDDEGILAEIASVSSDSELLIDPHTAVGTYAARRAQADGVKSPIIVLSTADPAKFPDAVERAVGARPELPAHLSELLTRSERFETMTNDLDAIAAKLRSLRS